MLVFLNNSSLLIPYLITMKFMNLITIPIEQAKNKKSEAAEKIARFARQHAFFEGKLDEKGRFVKQEAKMIIVRKEGEKVFISIENVEIIDPRGRYSSEYNQGNRNPDTLDNRVNREISPESVSLLERIIKESS